MADIEQKVVYTADFTSLADAFETTINEINSTREKMKGLKNDTEEYEILSRKLAEDYKELNRLMASNNGEIDSSKTSYNALNTLLKETRKEMRAFNDETSRMNLAPIAKATNTQLTQMDRSMGVYSRNVGNYSDEVGRALRNVQFNTIQVARELPSLANGVQTFFIAIANNIPMLADAVRQYKEVAKAAKMSTGAAEASSMAHNSEAAAAGAATTAKNAEANANKVGAATHAEETAATVEALAAKKAELEARLANTQGIIAETKASLDSLHAEEQQLKARMNRLHMEKSTFEIETRLNILENERIDLTRTLHSAEVQLASTTEQLTTVTREYEAAQASALSKGAKGAVSGIKAIVGALLNWQTLIIVGVTMLAMYGKEIGAWIASLGKATFRQREWNNTIKEGAQNAAKAAAELDVYAHWATMASKSDEERTKAAKKALEIMGKTVNEENILMAKNADLTDSQNQWTSAVTETIKALVKQAEAVAVLDLITEKYKEYLKVAINAEQKKGKLGFGGALSYGLQVGAGIDSEDAMDNAIEGSDKRRQKKVDKALDTYEAYRDELLKMFNPSDLLDANGGGSGNDPDKWFSKWEIVIKHTEARLQELRTEYENVDLSAIWKYSAEGHDAYMAKFDEYAEHYKDDKKQYEEYIAQKEAFQRDYNDYHRKLQLQYLDAQKTEYEIEKQQLEEWYAAQKAIYENAGEDTTALVAEYNQRKVELEYKYRDEYKNASLSGVEYELAELKDKFNEILYEYTKKGIDTVNVTKEYEAQKAAIISKYEAENTKRVLESIRKQEDAAMRLLELTKQQAYMGVNPEQESNYAKYGGTTVTGHQMRQGEIAATQGEMGVFQSSMNEQIAAMQAVLDSGKLVGEEKLEMETELANAEMELALGTAEYEMQLNQMVLDDTRETVNDRLSAIQNVAQGVGDIFDDVYSAIEYNMEAQIKSGKITEEEAEKELEKYRGIKAASAAMDAMASAVGAYQSLASIPYVGPALGAVAAAAALAAGFMQVKAIMAVSKDNATTSEVDSFTPALSDFNPQVNATVTGASEQVDLQNAIANGMGQANIWVSVTDIEDKQNQVKATDRESSF